MGAERGTCTPEVLTDASSTARCVSYSAISAHKFLKLFEPSVGFEPTTCCLQNSCSTTELRRQLPKAAKGTCNFIKKRRKDQPPEYRGQLSRTKRRETKINTFFDTELSWLFPHMKIRKALVLGSPIYECTSLSRNKSKLPHML